MSNYDLRTLEQSPEYRQELALQRTYMARVYGWMTIGLLITALVALVVASDRAMVQAITQSGVFIALIIAQFAIVIGLSVALRKLPVPVAAGLFLLYSAITGATFSILLLAYTLSSIGATFFITAGMFGSMSAFGYVTKRDLSGMGQFLIMGLIGLVIAMFVNFFMHSSAMEWFISFIGVIIFTGLTAYDTQKIKQMYAMDDGTGTFARKTAIYGAFALYLDFINLFLFLLRFMGNRRN